MKKRLILTLLFGAAVLLAAGTVAESRGNLQKKDASDADSGIESPRFSAIDLKPVFNMGFRDEKADDGKGGWTDQGPYNDLAMMKPGKLSAHGVEFDIVNPDHNHGRCCLVLSIGSKFSAEKTITCEKTPGNLPYLYLLHAAAGALKPGQTVGTITAEYADGTKKDFQVLVYRDVGNWWNPFSIPNGNVAWSGKNKSTNVGLYLSCFSLGGMPEKLTFRGVQHLAWMIVGADLGDRQLKLNEMEPSCIVAGKDYHPLDFDGTTVPGSPLDFSNLLDAPAGKYGPVTIDRNGHFSFRDAPEKRIRFFGTNLVDTSNYLDKKTADDFAAKITRIGYNSVRFHHYENLLLDPDSPDSLTFNPKTLDQLDYLFSVLKQHGVYLCLDLYASRFPRPGDNIEERKNVSFNPYDFEMKALIPLSPTALANWKEFARRLLTHRNPYTGLTWAEDPALYSLNLINENPLGRIWNWLPQLRWLFEKKYVEFLQAHGLDTPENRASRGGIFIEFLNDIQTKCIEEQKRFLKQELKLTALITDLNNFAEKSTLTPVRDHLDFVDSHSYWGSQKFLEKMWNPPILYENRSSIAEQAFFLRYLMPVRIFGKPYTVTEFNFYYPDPNRLEIAALLGGYAGLQDWDGLYRFAWSHFRKEMMRFWVPFGGLNTVNDPQAHLTERIISLVFLRNYIRPASPAFAFTITPEQIRALPGPPNSKFNGNYPDAFTRLGLYARIGSLNPEKAFPGVRKVDPSAAGWQEKLPQSARTALTGLEKNGKITSANGEITLDAKAKSLKIVSPKCEIFTFTGDLAGKIMRLANGSRYQTVALLSLDDRELAESRNMLLIQMPNTAATKMKFRDQRHTILESWGVPPLLVETCKVDVELTLPADCQVEALKLDGSSLGAISSHYHDGKLRFTADTAAKKEGVMVYHLTR